jgi:hypothetical protein
MSNPLALPNEEGSRENDATDEAHEIRDTLIFRHEQPR